LEWNHSLILEVKEKLDYLYGTISILRPKAKGSVSEDFISALSNDLSFSDAWAVLTGLAKSANAYRERAMQLFGERNWEGGEIARSKARRFASYLLGSGRLFGIFGYTPQKWLQGELYFGEMREDLREIETLITARTAARAAKNWAESDRIRDELAAAGIILEDGPGGTTWRRA